MAFKHSLKERKQRRIYDKKYNQKHPEKILKKGRLNAIKKKAKFLEIKKQYSCEICGENHPACLVFHHRDPGKKKIGIAVAAQRYSLKRLMAEIAKCQILCANCHRKLHFYDREKNNEYL